MYQKIKVSGYEVFKFIGGVVEEVKERCYKAVGVW